MFISKCRWGISFITVFLVMASAAVAQDYRGKVQGAVVDVNGAAVVGAGVTLRNDGTGVAVTRQTNDDGRYIFDFVDPGTYTVTVEQANYKKFEQQNVVVRNRGDVTADATLEAGGVEDVVTVTAPAAEVEFNTSGSALTIENKIVDQLPIRGRNPYNIATLDPTVSPGTGSTANENRPYHHAFANDIDAGGGTRSGNDVQLDGVPLTSSFKTSYTPNMDAVQEVTFQKNAVDSEYGYSSGGIVIVNTKGGTNEFHGTAFVNGRSPRFNAVSDPTVSRIAGSDETLRRGSNLKIYGGSLGGPVLKNKLFFFATYEKWTDSQPATFITTVPTEAERRGDFSQSSRGTRNIFDPFTSTGASGVRAQFPGNIIPASRFDPTAVRLLDQIPLPNLPGNLNNLEVIKTNKTTYWNFSTRVDWNPSERWKTFVRYGQFKANLLEENPTSAALLPINGSNRYGLSIAADTVYTLSSTMVLNLRGRYNSLTDAYAAEPAQLGPEGFAALFPGTNFAGQILTAPNVYYPGIDMVVGSTTYRLGRPGREFFQEPQGYGGSARLNIYLGDHAVKFGGELRVDKGKGARFEPLNLRFTQAFTANQATGGNLNTSGSEWASFLLGVVDNNTAARIIPLQEVVSKGYSAYFMDDWKASDRLTLNLGLRWEYEPAPVDPANRLTRRLDLTDPIPEFQAAPPAIPAAVTNLLATQGITQQFTGAWVFADEENRGAWERDKLNLLPRLGAAFRINDKSVIRFGYSRYIAPSQRIRDPLGDFVNQYTGFASVTSAIALQQGRPQAILSNPFPEAAFTYAPLPTSGGIANVIPRNPVQPPRGFSLGRYTNLGNQIGTAGNVSDGLDAPFQKPPINDRFTLSYQRSIWGRMVLDLDYFFNSGHRLPFAQDINAVDPIFSYTVARSVLNQSVPNPFFNILTPDRFPGSLRNTPNTTVGALLRPFPQYLAINQTNIPGRKERLHSFTVQVQRPFSKGLSFVLAYAHNREKTTEFFDDVANFNREFEWFDTESPRHRLTNAVTWDLPVGRGRWLLTDAPRVVDYVLGGWTLTAATRIYSGRLLIFGQNNLLEVVGDPVLDGPERGIPTGQWFNRAAFRLRDNPNDPNLPPQVSRRTNPRSFDGLYGPSAWQTDITLSKGFQLTERFKLEARVEAYNAFNHLNFENPSTDFNNANFGRVINKHVAYSGREVQYGLRLVF